MIFPQARALALHGASGCVHAPRVAFVLGRVGLVFNLAGGPHFTAVSNASNEMLSSRLDVAIMIYVSQFNRSANHVCEVFELCHGVVPQKPIGQKSMYCTQSRLLPGLMLGK